VFRIGDCQILILLGAKLNVGVPFCHPDPITPIPSVVNVAQTLKNTYDATLGKFPIQPPELKLLRQNFDKALAAYEDAVAPIEALRTQIEAQAVRSLMLAQIVATVTAHLNARGYSRHNAVVQIMMLQDWGLGKPWMSDAVTAIVKPEEEPLNPFFQYVANRRTNKESMLQLIHDECPADARDLQRLRTQWSWERNTNEKAWLNKMYWDCLFIAAAYTEKQGPPPDDNSTENALRSALDQLIKQVEEAQKVVEQALTQITDLLGDVTNPGNIITHPPLLPLPSLPKL
jgi:hypothetical protein